MSDLFLKIINMSISASWLILAVLLLRLVLKKAPKWVNVLLWGIVAVRLICPLTIESSVSLIPDSIGSGKLVSEWVDDYIDDVDIHHSDSVYYDAAIGAGREPISDGEGGYYVVTKHDQLGEPATIENTVIPVISVVWVMGIALLGLYTVISYWRLRRKVSEAVILRGNIYQSENVGSPFVLGIIRPKVYLPYNMDEQDLSHVVAHEQAHIRRRDHWWNPLGFLLLTIHWFNPLMWLAYVLLCRDIELACDEKVIKELGNEQRADYTQALVACSVKLLHVAACPLAFGEVGVKERVESVVNYKKPAFWIIILSVIACIVVAVCFLTDPKDDEPNALPLLHSHSYGVVEVTYETAGTSFSMVAQQNTPVYAISESMRLMSKGEHASEDEWVALGTLTETELTSDNFDKLFSGKGHWVGKETASSIRKNTVNAWTLVYNQDVLYYVLQQKNGEVYLAHGYYDYSEKSDPASDDTTIRWLFKLAYNLSEDTGIIAVSGENIIPVVVFPSDTSVKDMKDSIHWLDIAPGTDETVPFTILCDGKEQYGFYSVYDAKTFEPLDFVRPSGLAPQTYLFQNAEYGHEYIVVMQHSLGGADRLCFGAKIGNVYHNKLLSVKIEEIGADEAVEATYNYFDITPFESVTLPGVHTAVFSIEEVSEYVHISFEKPLYHNEQELWKLQMRVGEMLHLTTAPDGGTAYTFSFIDKSDVSNRSSAQKWFDYLVEPDNMSWGGRLEIDIPEFPDVTFRWYPEKMEAVTEKEIGAVDKILG